MYPVPRIGSKPGRILSLASNEDGEKVMMINFRYDLDLIFAVRKLPGRLYHPKLSCWSAPIYKDTVEILTRLGFTMDEKLERFVHKLEEQEKEVAPDLEIKGLKGTLYPFQKKGVAFIESRHGRALIADEMGLGKTIQALAWLQLHPKYRPAVVIAPSIAKLHWARKAEEWMTNPNTEVLSGERPWIPSGDIIIINYDVLPKWIPVLLGIGMKVIITDECHYYKNNKALRTKAVKTLNKYSKYFIAISGTPIKNRPVEIFNAVNAISPGLLGPFWDFTKRYCDRKHTRFGWDYSGASNLHELFKILTDTIMIRRLKKDVLKDLPPKTFSFVPIEMDNEDEYRVAEADFIAYIKRFKGDAAAIKAARAKAFVRTEGLKQLAVKGKLNSIVQWITEFLESDQKLVVFAHHVFVIKLLMESFPGISVKIDGSTTDKQKQQAEDLFQHDKRIRLLFGNLQAAGQVITLTAASNVAIIELPWTPGDISQAVDRCHRISQKYRVMVYYLLAVDTIEEKIAKLLDRKRMVLDAVLDGQDTKEEDLLMDLIKEYT